MACLAIILHSSINSRWKEKFTVGCKLVLKIPQSVELPKHQFHKNHSENHRPIELFNCYTDRWLRTSVYKPQISSQVVSHQHQPPTGDSLWVAQCPWATDISQKLHGSPLQGESCRHDYQQYRHFNSLRCPSSISSWSESSKREFLFNRERYGGNKSGFKMPG